MLEFLAAESVVITSSGGGLFTMDNAIALLALASLEIVLGIDNIVFISILSAKLPPEKQNMARKLGLIAALVMRLILLFCIKWVMGLNSELFSALGHSFTGRDLVLLIGGLFLIAKATYEIHEKLEGPEHEVGEAVAKAASMGAVITQIMILDMVFSLDSVITAVGMVDEIAVMITAVVIAMIVMLIAVNPISDFVERHPTMKMLALAFLLLIGVMLTAEGMGQHINKGYIYFAMAFSLFVEILNMKVRSNKTKKVRLHSKYQKADA
jgi:predicted tellurium resistance membrane protein TerC